ncbi:MAG: hypothetical protein JST26_19790 [Bacteroidetes bacterium]|nr:hypothetical protein [Bacteroidota bacterium]
MRAFAGLAIIISFLAWVAYRLYKKDLKQNMFAFYTYLTFAGVWCIIYALCLLT